MPIGKAQAGSFLLQRRSLPLTAVLPLLLGLRTSAPVLGERIAVETQPFQASWREVGRLGQHLYTLPYLTFR